jgi:hypothetical protein
MKRQKSGWYKLSFNNYVLTEAMVKAISCILPFLVNVEEVEFIGNGITDLMSSILALSIFMNPTIDKVAFSNNHVRGAFVNVFKWCIPFQASKLLQFSVMGSFSFVEHFEKFSHEFYKFKSMQVLNISNCPVSAPAARLIGRLMVFHG